MFTLSALQCVHETFFVAYAVCSVSHVSSCLVLVLVGTLGLVLVDRLPFSVCVCVCVCSVRTCT